MTYAPSHVVARGRTLRCSFFAVACLVFESAFAAEAKKPFNVQAGDAAKTLAEFSAQAGGRLLYSSEMVAGVQTNAVKGEFRSKEALDRMVQGTRLIATEDQKSGTLAVREETETESKNAPRVAPTSDRPETAGTKRDDGTLLLETFEVFGSKLLNMDLPRSRDDAQPYVIFEREMIEQSGATDLQDFFRSRLTMDANSYRGSEAAASTTDGNRSAIKLRGLNGQTLILVDGRRLAGFATSGTVGQPDINGIPLSAVERIEILPTTASGIHGGSATGGVINIITRRNYAGVEISGTYDNTFDTDSAIRTTEISGGLASRSGRTNVIFAASYSDANTLALGDRNFARRGRASILRNNPATLLNPANPPLGRTPNLRSVNGSPLFGPGTSYFTSVPSGHAGGGGLAPLQRNAGNYNLELSDTQIRAGSGAKSTLRNGPTVKSARTTLRHQFNDRLQAFAEWSGSSNIGHLPVSRVFNTSYTIAANAPNNPFGQAIRVSIPLDVPGALDFDSGADTFATGLIVRLPKNWSAEADYTWNRSTSIYRTPGQIMSGAETAAISNGTLDVLRDFSTSPINLVPYLATFDTNSGKFATTLNTATLRVGGALLTLPAGEVTMSSLVERNAGYVAAATAPPATNAGVPTYYPPKSQLVDSAYAELKLPVLAAAQRFPGINLLDVQLAARLDRYTSRTATTSVALRATAPVISEGTSSFRSTNPTVAFRYRPFSESLTVRGSYGTGFLPPSLSDLVPPRSSGTVTLANPVLDPRRGNEPLAAFELISGGNPNMRPEKSESRSAGVILAPRIIPGFRLSLDWTRIEKTDNISSLQTQQYLLNEQYFPELIVRAAAPVSGPYNVGPVIRLHSLRVNVSSTFVEAWDAQLDYTREIPRLGVLDLFVTATRQTHFVTRLAASSPEVETIGIEGLFTQTPLKLRVTGGATWRRGPATFGWSVRYIDSYLVADPSVATNAATILNQGRGGRVPSQTYHDANLTWRFSATRADRYPRRLIQGLQLQLGVRNIFNLEPPYDAANGPFYFSPLGETRLASYYLKLKRAF